MKIVLMRNIKYNYNTAVIAEDDGSLKTYRDEYVQASEVVDVDFSLIEVDIAAAKVALIDEDISKAEAGIHLLKQAKAELLALPDMGAE